MKKLIFTLMILETIIFSMKGQPDSTSIPQTFCSGEFYETDFNSVQPIDSSWDIKITCGIEINHFTTNSSFKPGIEFSFFVKGSNGRRSLEVAAFYDNETKKISGISIHHKFMF